MQQNSEHYPTRHLATHTFKSAEMKDYKARREIYSVGLHSISVSREYREKHR